MPYIDRHGNTVPRDIAIDARGDTRPGFFLTFSGGVLPDGGRVAFNPYVVDRSQPSTSHFFCDVPSASRKSVDATVTDAVNAIVDRQHAAHDAKFEFLGDQAPAFDRGKADFLARKRFETDNGSVVRAVIDARWNTPASPASAQPAATVDQSSAVDMVTGGDRRLTLSALRYS